MKVTVCEMIDAAEDLESEWQALVAHVRRKSSELVLLPEMPFAPFVAATCSFDPMLWNTAVRTHEEWLSRMDELAPATGIATRPLLSGRRRLNEGFVWEPGTGYRRAHLKYYLPEEEGYWEATWFARGNGDFASIDCGGARIGFLICSELWFPERARAYGQAGVHVIVTPRSTGRASVDKWLIGGRAAAIVSGAFSLSSNRVSHEHASTDFGGQGWIVGPDGEVLGLTSRSEPFVTVDIDLGEAERAKQTYPRYMR